MATVSVAGDGVALLYCAIILLVLSWVIFSLRVGVRVWRKAWGMGMSKVTQYLSTLSTHSMTDTDTGDY
jgi:hypothetical protein